MMGFIKKHDIILKLLCVLVTVLLWIYIVSTDRPDTEREFKNVRVTLQNQNKILDNYGLAVISDDNPTVNIRVSGSRERIYKIGGGDNILVTADVSSITTQGTHQLLYNVTLPVDGLEIISRAPAYVTVEADKMISMTVPVRVKISGDVPKGYTLGDYSVSPENIVLEGPNTSLAGISEAIVNVTVDEQTAASGHLSYTLEYSLVDAEGNAVMPAKVTGSSKTVVVSIPVTRTKTVPLTAELLSSPGIDKSFAAIDVTPKTIDVTGDDEILNTLNQINLGTIDLSKVQNGETVEMPIVLPNGVRATDGGEKAAVKVTINGIGNVNVVVRSITAECDSGNFNAVVLTESLEAVIIGPETEIARITPETVTAHAEITEDIIGGSLRAGDFTVPVSLHIENAEYAAAAETYTVTVRLEEKQ